MRLSLTNLVCVLFDPAIPTLSVSFIQLFLYLFLFFFIVLSVITPRACARGKAIGLSVCCRHCRWHEIARSCVLGICVSCKQNQSVDIREKLVCTRFELLKKAY